MKGRKENVVSKWERERERERFGVSKQWDNKKRQKRKEVKDIRKGMEEMR